jgi:hypothetical protein
VVVVVVVVVVIELLGMSLDGTGSNGVLSVGWQK